MSYCLNPECPHPENANHAEICQACGSKLLLRDRYRVLRPLGQGGFGATFLAVDQVLPGEPISVIKQLRPSSTDPQVLEMARELFEREARTLGKIGNHPQVPRLLDYFADHKQFYLVQEYVSGATLQQEVKERGPFSEAGAKQFLCEILPLLEYIHSQQVIHRDIKPANIIRREQDRKLVLIDFGAVKNQVTQTAVQSGSEQTAFTAYAIGTPGFAPPEQMAMRPVYASDIYALGVTCIYLLTGKSPKNLDYNPSTGEMLWYQNLDISEQFTEVLKKMLEVSVKHRYQSAPDVLKALDLAPYMEGLAEGLITKSTNPPSLPRNSPQSGDLSKLNTSASSQLGSAIRERRLRMEKNPSPLASPAPRVVPEKITPTANPRNINYKAPASKAPNKLDASSIVSSYTKGRRDFGEQDLSNLNLQKVNLSGGNFHAAKLHQTNLQGANLSHTDFGRSSLNGAIFKDANLVKAYFSYADLEGADLRGADLSYAYFHYANLRGANLSGANLTGAKIDEEQIAQAKTNWATVLPNGKRGLW